MKESEPVIGRELASVTSWLRCQPRNASGTRDPQILPKNAPLLAFSFVRDKMSRPRQSVSSLAFVSTPSFSPQGLKASTVDPSTFATWFPPSFVGCRTSPHCVAFDPAFPLREH